MNARLCFLSHFVIVLACAGLAFFAWTRGVPQTVYANDASMMTSVIAALFVGTAVYLGRLAWLADGPGVLYLNWGNRDQKHFERIDVSSDFGHNAERWAVMLGFVGTAIGLSLQAKSLAGGATSFTALATSLFTTASGGTAAILIGVMTYSLEQGIRRARK
jgi:hypothetical protein